LGVTQSATLIEQMRETEVDGLGQRRLGALIDQAQAERDFAAEVEGGRQGHVDGLHFGLDGGVAADPTLVVLGLQGRTAH
jgi:hypothetical protein